jgi:hypothetical protein
MNILPIPKRTHDDALRYPTGRNLLQQPTFHMADIGDLKTAPSELNGFPESRCRDFQLAAM